MALDDIRDQLSRGARTVQHTAERLKDGIEKERRRHLLETELDTLFSELGIEVYQRLQRGDPVEESVVVGDIVDRIAEVEQMMQAQAESDEDAEPT